MEDEERMDLDEVYDDDGREDLVENDEISPEEEAFMAGYEETSDKEKKSKLGDEAYEKAFEKNSNSRRR